MFPFSSNLPTEIKLCGETLATMFSLRRLAHGISIKPSPCVLESLRKIGRLGSYPPINSTKVERPSPKSTDKAALRYLYVDEADCLTSPHESSFTLKSPNTSKRA